MRILVSRVIASFLQLKPTLLFNIGETMPAGTNARVRKTVQSFRLHFWMITVLGSGFATGLSIDEVIRSGRWNQQLGIPNEKLIRHPGTHSMVKESAVQR
jgi:hypothetical protein